MEENSIGEVHATTHFSTDAVARGVEPAVAGKTQRFDALTARDWSGLSLHSLLSQPVIVASGVATGDLDIAWFSHSKIFDSSEFHVDKVRGYMGIRASIVVRLVVNADKYTQGRLSLAYQPSKLDFVPDKSDHRRVSQLTHVELDLNSDTEVTLRIPHRGPYTHFDLTNRRFDPGVFRVTNLLPFRGSPFAYTIYASFEDVHLLGPTAITTVNYQGGKLSEKEERNVPLSEKVALSAIAMTPIGAAIPTLAPFVVPGAAILAAGAGIMAAFGWSRPLKTTTPEVYVKRQDAKYNHCDGTDYAEQLAITTTSGVRVTEQLGLTELDEMSFPFLMDVSSILFRTNYGVTTPSGTLLRTIPLCPLAMSADSAIAGARIAHPMCYIANLFNFYRGSISMTIDLAKTIFHSGRLMIVFEPITPDMTNTGNTLPAPRVSTLSDAINCHKDIVDIRKGNTFSFTFPFVSLTPYLPVDAPYGYVHIFVLNQLVRNDTAVSDLIDMSLKFRGESDFDFQGPSVPRLWPYQEVEGDTVVQINDSTTNAAGSPVPTTLPGFTYESGLEVGDTTIVRKPIGSSSVPSHAPDMADLCAGELIRSAKQIAMRSKLVYGGAGGGRIPRNPFSVDTFLSSTFGQPDTIYSPYFDFYSYIGSMYNYVRGGVVLNVENTASAETINVHLKSDSHYFPINTANRNAEFSLRGAVLPDSSERFYLPPYDTSICRFTTPTPLFVDGGLFDPLDVYYGFGYNSNRFQVTGQNSGAQASNYKLSRCAAEDTQFGGFVGVPLVVLRAPFSVFEGSEEYKVQRIVNLGFPNS